MSTLLNILNIFHWSTACHPIEDYVGPAGQHKPQIQVNVTLPESTVWTHIFMSYAHTHNVCVYVVHKYLSFSITWNTLRESFLNCFVTLMSRVPIYTLTKHR